MDSFRELLDSRRIITGTELCSVLDSFPRNNQYLNEYVKGKRQAAKFVKKMAYKFLESNNYKLENIKDEGYVFLLFERVIQGKADDIVKQKIIKLLKNIS